ncbi:MAG: hypothetical protein QOJ94_74 [Sphingomonadales bacterium]|nr:hypothetical protein [Sphingomonadales bacterium]
MQRVRIGLTGLAFVFILVLLGAIFARPSDEEPAANVIDRLASRNQAASSTATNEALPKEPLAELGVAPGGAEENETKAPGPAPAGR